MFTKRSVLFFALLSFSILMLTSVLLLPSAYGAGGRGSGGGEWQYTGRSANLQNYCDANVQGTVCVEWCDDIGGNLVPSGNLCCWDGFSALPSGDSERDCSHWIPPKP